jgi:hypothetical protein
MYRTGKLVKHIKVTIILICNVSMNNVDADKIFDYENEINQLFSLLQNATNECVLHTIKLKWRTLLENMLCVEDPALFEVKDWKKRPYYTNLIERKDVSLQPNARKYFALSCALIAYVRDYRIGMGNRRLCYMMLFECHTLFQDIAVYILFYCVSSNVKCAFPYGSWRDIRGLMQYTYSETRDKNHPLIQMCKYLICEQIKQDLYHFMDYCFKEGTKTLSLSLAAKWCPRENRKTDEKWMFKDITQYFFDYINGDTSLLYAIEMLTDGNFDGSQTLFKTPTSCTARYQLMRQLLSALNRNINTTEQMMCENEWQRIDMRNVPSLAFQKYHRAFLRVSPKKKQTVDTEFKKRVLCKTHCDYFIRKGNGLKVSSLNIEYIIKEAIRLENSKPNSIYRIQLNKIWKKYLEKYDDHTFHNSIVLLDLSRDTEEPECTSSVCNTSTVKNIGRAIEYSFLSTPPFRNRMLVAANTPRWIDFSWDVDVQQDIVEIVKTIRNLPCGTHNTLKPTIKYLFDSFTSFQFKHIDQINIMNISSTFSEETVRTMKQIGNSHYQKHHPHIIFMSTKVDAETEKNVSNWKTVYDPFVFVNSVDYYTLRHILQIRFRSQFRKKQSHRGNNSENTNKNINNARDTVQKSTSMSLSQLSTLSRSTSCSTLHSSSVFKQDRFTHILYSPRYANIISRADVYFTQYTS